MNNVSTKKEAAARVTALRYNHGHTYAAASRATGFPAGSLSYWERKVRCPRSHNLLLLRVHTQYTPHHWTAPEELPPSIFGGD